MARPRGSELEFGSDSFLDIIANIVGILIILIVIAGVRAARAPVAAPLDEAATISKPQAVAGALRHQPARASVRFAGPKPGASARRLMVAIPVAPKPPKQIPRGPIPELPVAPVPTPRPDLDAALPGKIAALNSSVAELRDLQAQFRLQLLAAQTERKSVDESLKRMAAVAGSDAKRQAEIAALVTEWKSTATKSNQTLLALQRQYDEARRAGSNAKRVVHLMTAVGKEVHGKEMHFRVAGGRVARVPLKRLVEEMKKDVGRRKEWLIKFPLHKGTVGPIDGFKMHYVVRREGGSIAEELRSGYRQIRLLLAGWRIEPTSDFEGETPDRALRTGSDFHRHLQFAENGTTLTFWVYPDSFGFYRRLLHAARAAGFQVAARPLPFGMPIAGSPRGTRSSGQ